MFSREHDELEELRGKQVNRTPEINYFSNYSQPGPLFRGFWEEKNLIYKLTDPKVLTLNHQSNRNPRSRSQILNRKIDDFDYDVIIIYNVWYVVQTSRL